MTETGDRSAESSHGSEGSCSFGVDWESRQLGIGDRSASVFLFGIHEKSDFRDRVELLVNGGCCSSSSGVRRPELQMEECAEGTLSRLS